MMNDIQIIAYVLIDLALALWVADEIWRFIKLLRRKD
jgi:hypothetical protein